MRIYVLGIRIGPTFVVLTPFFKFEDVLIYDASCPGIGKGEVITIVALRDILPNFSKLLDIDASDLSSLIESE